MPLIPGTRLGRYEVRSKLGEGGMGEVYLARDTELDRLIALKVLPAETTADQQRLQRFLQEARAASKLKSANVAHIYEIGEADGLRFIAMEYVEGEPLDAHIRGRQLPAAEITRIATEIARALEEAHTKGVTHRDIKPQNIIVTPAGDVKVLDFGLAKLDAATPSGGEIPDDELATRVKTTPGIVMGTVSYMSPEQAMGRADVDSRTDIFSLGVVLYEMATGRLPFAGASITETIDRIVHAQPEAIARFNYDVPADLEVVIKKALRKDRDERYQTARELLIDLRALQRELDATSHLQHSAVQDSRSSVGASARAASSDEQRTAILTDERRARSTAETPAADVSAAAAARPTSSAEYVVEKIKRHKWGVALALVLLVVALPFGGYMLYHVWSVHRHPDEGRAPLSSFQNAKLQRLTTTGKATLAAISPDGKLVVHVKSEGGRESLWLRQAATTSDTQIVAPSDNRYWGLTVSPDANYVYYVASEGEYNALARTLYQVPVLGGASRKVLDGVTSPVTFSPDGKRFAFVRYTQSETDENILMLANADGSGEQKLATRGVSAYSLEGPSWSPDGKIIACGARNNDKDGRYWNLVAISVADGTEKEVSSQHWGFRVGQVAWLADGSGLVLVAKDQASGTPRQLWYVSYPEGEARKITNDLNEYIGVSIAADSGTLVTVQSDTTANISIAPATDANNVKQITNGKSEGETGLSWMPDGHVVYDSNASGSINIWVTDADGKNQKQLTNDAGNNHTPSATPDGRYILFVSNRAVTQNIWRMNVDGSNQVQLTHGTNEFWVRSTPDSKWAIYTSTDSGKDAVWKVPVEGGERVRITEDDTRSASVSPDMKLFACLQREEKIASPFRVALYSFDDGHLVRMLDVSQFIKAGVGFRWSADGRALLYIDTRGGISNIWSLPLDGGKVVQLTDFKTGEIFWFDLSRDGRQFAFSRGAVTNDVVLIKDFK
jgi:serine/threonine protein kinase/Tol biopolymer transport system component